jgi:mannose-6-phosphate isomerase-like protein (cupin superfamily)
MQMFTEQIRVGKYALIIALLCCTNHVWGQINLSKFEHTSNGSIRVSNLAGDSLTNSFIITITDSVKLHMHQYHSEHIYVISGSAQLTLGENKFEINPGDYVFIPRQTPHKAVVLGTLPLRVLSIQSPAFDGTDRTQLE